MQVNLFLLSLVLLVSDLHANAPVAVVSHVTKQAKPASQDLSRSVNTAPKASVDISSSSVPDQIHQKPVIASLTALATNNATVAASTVDAGVGRENLTAGSTQLAEVKLDNVVGMASKTILKYRPSAPLHPERPHDVSATNTAKTHDALSNKPSHISLDERAGVVHINQNSVKSSLTSSADKSSRQTGSDQVKQVAVAVSANAQQMKPVAIASVPGSSRLNDASNVRKYSSTKVPEANTMKVAVASTPNDGKSAAVTLKKLADAKVAADIPQSNQQRISQVVKAQSPGSSNSPITNATKASVADLSGVAKTKSTSAAVASVVRNAVGTQASKTVTTIKSKSVPINLPETKAVAKVDTKLVPVKRTKVTSNILTKPVAVQSPVVVAKVKAEPTAVKSTEAVVKLNSESTVIGAPKPVDKIEPKPVAKIEPKPKPVKPPKLVTVKEVKHTKNPTFQSTIRPIVRSSVVTPVRGKIVHVNKFYGDHVKKNDLIISLSSNEAKKELMSNVVDFIQSKDGYHEALATLKKNIELQKKGVISKQELNSSQSSYISSLINMVRTRIEFKKLAQSLEFDWHKIDNLDFTKQPLLQQQGGAEDIVEFLLNKQYILKLDADETGIFLPKITQDSNQEPIDFVAGGTVKEDQVIGMIADPKRLRLRIEVPEFDVLKFKKGQPAVMKIPVLKNISMPGEISEIRRFEYNQRSGQIPTIPVTVDIACKENCERFYSISAEVSIVNPPETTLQVPLSAVGKSDDYSQHPQHYVKILVEGKITKKLVTVGSTTADSIVIVNGLSKGDQIVENYKNPES